MSTGAKRKRGALLGGRLLHLDTFSGIAGNMFLGALLDAGLSRRELEADLAGLGVAHKLVVKRVRREPLAALYVDVVVPGAKRARRPRHAHGEHAHAHDAHGEPHHHEPALHAGHAHRSYAEIRKLLGAAKLEPAVRERAQAIFAALARAEAHVHGIAVERVRFHEVGAVDAIVDVTGAAIALARLGITRVTATPPALGSGRIESAHGGIPLPAPATLELLRGRPVSRSEVSWETVTPTGAAILHEIVDEYCTLPPMTIESIGHGAGSDRQGPLPNVLRAVLGRSSPIQHDRVVVLEANLDDLVPEHFDHVMERLLEAGALDVSLQHVQMKKNRPGFLLRVVASPVRARALAEGILTETTTLGVRSLECERWLLPRETREVSTAHGRIRVKLSTRPDGSPEFSPEYDDCKRAASKAGVPLRDVIRAAEEAARLPPRGERRAR